MKFNSTIAGLHQPTWVATGYGWRWAWYMPWAGNQPCDLRKEKEKKMSETKLGETVPCVQHYNRFVFTIDQDQWHADQKVKSE